MTYTIAEINAAKLDLLREDIADRFTKAIDALYELSVRTENDENATRLTDKMAAMEDVLDLNIATLTSKGLTAFDVRLIADYVGTRGTTTGAKQGYALAADYIISYLR
jgi:hypothetical protein